MTPDDDLPDDGPPAAVPAGQRTVMVSPADLAALHGDAPPTAGADPFGAGQAQPGHPRGSGDSVSGGGTSGPRLRGDDGAGAGAAASVDPFGTAADPFGAASDPFGTPPADRSAAPAFAPPPAFVPPPSTPPAAPVASAPGGFVHGAPGALVGMHLNDLFEIVRFIAQGGMGEVYEGRNLASGERVAIKVILPQYAADEQFMALFRREASALERIGHDSLVKYRTLAFDRTNRVNYLAIEYVAGPSMAEILVGDPADPAIVRRVLKRLATGLGAAHDAGVIHRDLSPDNLLLPDGNVERCKIIDFGIAKDTSLDAKSVVGEAFAGKFGYAAPEIFGKFKRAVGPWTDVYSLALVMIAYARGAPLDMGVTIVDALEARDTVPDLSSLTPDLQPVFARMLAPDPAERFRSMDEVIAALDAPPGANAPVSPFGAPPSAPSTAPAEAIAPAFVRAAPTAPPVAAAAPRSRLPLYGGIAAAVVLAAGGGYALLGGRGTPPPAAPVAEAAPPSVAAAPATAAAAPTPDWATARPAVIAALDAVPCSDLRVAAVPTGKTVRLAGWHPAGVSVPATAGGLVLDSTDTVGVAQPAAATCALVRKIRAAAPPGTATGFTVAARQTVSLAGGAKGPTGGPTADLTPTGQPAGLARLQITTIEDSGAATAKDWVSSADVADAKADLSRLEFDPKPSRFLAILVASDAKPAPVTAAGADGVARACGGGRCALASGWVEITR